MSRITSARSIAKSEPLATVSPDIDSRPVSSYEVRRSPDEVQLGDPDVLQQLSRKLGIVGDHGVNLQWIVSDCLKSLNAAGWSCTSLAETVPPDLMFTHSLSGEKRSDHEIVDAHRELGVRVLFEHNEIQRMRRDPFYCIRDCLILDQQKLLKS